LLDPARLPSFSERLGLIGKQALQYRHMYPLSDDVGAIATSLFERFMPDIAECRSSITVGHGVADAQPLRW
jgi:hypothetical protein